MDAIVASAGSAAVTGTTPPPPPPAPEQVQPTASTVEAGRKGRDHQPFQHALFQGEGNKRGILKQMTTAQLQELVETQQRESGVTQPTAQVGTDVAADPVDDVVGATTDVVADEVTTAAPRLSPKALAVAEEVLAERLAAGSTEEFPPEFPPEVDLAAAAQPEFPPEGGVDTIPVEAANVDVEPPVGSLATLARQEQDGTPVVQLPDPPEDPAPPYGDGVVTITEFVQAGLQADTES